MSRRVFAFFLAAAMLCGLLSACGSAEEIEYRSIPTTAKPCREELTLSVEFSKRKNHVSARLENGSEQVLYDPYFELHKMIDNNWKRRTWYLPATEENSAGTLLLQPGEAMEQNLDVSYMVGELSAGHYRVYVTFYLEPEPDEDTRRSYVQYEFDVT